MLSYYSGLGQHTAYSNLEQILFHFLPDYQDAGISCTPNGYLISMKWSKCMNFGTYPIILYYNYFLLIMKKKKRSRRVKMLIIFYPSFPPCIGTFDFSLSLQILYRYMMYLLNHLLSFSDEFVIFLFYSFLSMLYG